MVKFIVQKEECSEESISNNSNQPSDDFSINIQISKRNIKNVKIGKFSFDEDTITRVSIVKLSSLGYKIKEIAKLLKISRMLAWKWAHWDKYKGKGNRKSKFTEDEKRYLCNKVDGKITGKEGISSRALKKDFFEKFNKNICHSTINTILNKNLSRPLRIVNTFYLSKAHEEKRLKF